MNVEKYQQCDYKEMRFHLNILIGKPLMQQILCQFYVKLVFRLIKILIKKIEVVVSEIWICENKNPGIFTAGINHYFLAIWTSELYSTGNLSYPLVTISLSTLFTNPCNTLPGPSSVNEVAPLAIMFFTV